MKISLFSAVVCTLCLFAGVHSALALTVSPVRLEMQGDPGQTISGEIELLNEESVTKSLFSSFENFEPAGDTGTPHFIGATDGLATWITSVPNIQIAPGEKMTVPFSVSIPKDAEPGGYFAAVFFGAQDPKIQEAGEVAIGGKLGVLILLRVRGNITESAGLSEFTTANNQHVFSMLPVSFSYRFTNTGGDRVVPLGDIVIKNAFGSVAETLSANEKEGNVLPKSSRRFTAVWGQVSSSTQPVSFLNAVTQEAAAFHLGVYTANVAVMYGTTNQTANASYTFVMIPWHLLLVVFVLFVLLLVLIRQYNRWIIAKSHKEK